jgi:hypothetical protein
MAATPEGKVKAAIKKELDGRGFWRAGAARPEIVEGWYYMPVSNGMGVHGIPDFMCCYHGKLFCIEAKAPGGQPTPNQLRRHEEIQAAHGVVLIVSDVAQLKEYFDEQGWT